MASTLTYSLTLHRVTCHCGIPFAIPESLHTRMQERSNVSCYCPNGHTMVFSKTEAQRLREELERTQRNLIYARNSRDNAERDLEYERRSKAAVRGHLTRMRNKIANGVCPVGNCRRHFTNVLAHLSGEHAGWLAEHDIELESL